MMSVSIRNGLFLVIAAIVPASVDAGLFAPFTCGTCGPRQWIGFTIGIPLLQPSDFGLSCWTTGCGYGGGYGHYGYGGHGCGGYSGCGPAVPPPLSYGCATAPNPCDCGINAPIAPPVMTSPAPAYIPPTTIEPPILPGPTSCLPDPCAQPVCQTTLQPQQYTTYQTVPTTQYRREAYVEHVPVTTYQPQTRYRDVAYTVNRQVAQTHTRYVPQPQISYMPQVPMASAPCSTCDQGVAYGLTPQYTMPTAPYFDGTASAVPTPIQLPQSATLPQSPAATLQAPVQSSSADSWETVPQRSAQGDVGVQQMGAWMPQFAPQRLQSPRPLFQPAPSAASVWQSSWLR